MAGPAALTTLFTDNTVNAPTLTQQQGRATVAAGALRELIGPNGEGYFEYLINEVVTLDTGGTTTDTTATIPVGTILVLTATRVQTTITTAANYSLGISGAGTRFQAASTDITAADTALGGALNVYTSATAIRITTNANPGAGAVRVVARCIGVRPPKS